MCGTFDVLSFHNDDKFLTTDSVQIVCRANTKINDFRYLFQDSVTDSMAVVVVHFLEVVEVQYQHACRRSIPPHVVYKID